MCRIDRSFSQIQTSRLCAQIHLLCAVFNIPQSQKKTKQQTQILDWNRSVGLVSTHHLILNLFYVLTAADTFLLNGLHLKSDTHTHTHSCRTDFTQVAGDILHLFQQASVLQQSTRTTTLLL